MKVESVYTKAMNFYREGNYVNALSAFRNSLELGNEKSAYGLAVCMYLGNGMFVDKSSAKQLIDGYLPRIEKYAEDGDSEAQQVLGLYYSSGYFVPPEREKAAQWFRRAAEQGDEDAKNYLMELEEN